jgi:WD40 repeat protein
MTADSRDAHTGRQANADADPGAEADAGHQGFILATVFSGDGAHLHSVSIEGELCRWHLASGALNARWPVHEGPVLDLKRSGTTLVTGGLDGTVGVWEESDGSLIRRLSGHDGGVHGVALCDSFIASGSADGRIGIWDRTSGALIRFLDGHEETVTSVVFLDERTLASGSRDRTVRIWDITGGAPRRVLRGHDWWVTRIARAADGSILSASEDATLRLWDADTGRQIWTFDDCPGPVWGMAVHPGGRRAAFGYGGQALELDLDALTTRRVPNEAPVSGRAFSYSADGGVLAVGQDNGDIEVTGLERSARIARLKAAGRRILSGIARSDLTVTGHIGGEVVSAAGDAGFDHVGHEFFVYATRHLGGLRFATGGFDHKLKVWEPGQGEPLAVFDHGGLIFSLVAGQNSGCVLAAGWDRISLWDLALGEPVWVQANAGVGNHLVAAFCDGEQTVAGVGEAPLLKIWRIGAGEQHSWPMPEAHNCTIEAIPDQNRAIVGNASGRISLVELEDGSSRLLHAEHEDWIRIARVAADGQRVATVSQNGTARVYDLMLDKVVERFAHQAVAVVDFDPTGGLCWIDCLGRRHAE